MAQRLDNEGLDKSGALAFLLYGIAGTGGSAQALKSLRAAIDQATAAAREG